MSRDELIVVCAWKTPRSKPLVARNKAADVEAVTRATLSTDSEVLRIWTPMALDGVSWATASVLLHLAHKDPYPVFDYRAMESLGRRKQLVPTVSFWLAYVAEFRRLLAETRVDKRTLDRALWQWSKENPKG